MGDYLKEKMMSYIFALVLFLIVFVCIVGHKKACAQSNKKLEQIFLDNEQVIRKQWENKSNQEHWLFKTNFPDAITFSPNTALNHELELVQVVRKLYKQSHKR